MGDHSNIGVKLLGKAGIFYSVIFADVVLMEVETAVLLSLCFAIDWEP